MSQSIVTKIKYHVRKNFELNNLQVILNVHRMKPIFVTIHEIFQ